jgi:hypothetical protein
MKPMFVSIIVATLWIGCNSAAIAESRIPIDQFPIKGSYGFDWLNPIKAKCIKIDSKLSAKFQGCDYSKNYSFGLGYDTYSCKISSHSEYIILKTKAQCQKTLETMQANAE